MVREYLESLKSRRPGAGAKNTKIRAKTSQGMVRRSVLSVDRLRVPGACGCPLEQLCPTYLERTDAKGTAR